MNRLITIVKDEPVLISGLATAALSLAASFGLELTKEQTAAIMAFLAAGMALAARFAVTPNSRVAAKVEAATGEVVTGPALPPEGQPAEVEPDPTTGTATVRPGATSAGWRSPD